MTSLTLLRFFVVAFLPLAYYIFGVNINTVSLQHANVNVSKRAPTPSKINDYSFQTSLFQNLIFFVIFLCLFRHCRIETPIMFD